MDAAKFLNWHVKHAHAIGCTRFLCVEKCSISADGKWFVVVCGNCLVNSYLPATSSSTTQLQRPLQSQNACSRCGNMGWDMHLATFRCIIQIDTSPQFCWQKWHERSGPAGLFGSMIWESISGLLSMFWSRIDTDGTKQI